MPVAPLWGQSRRYRVWVLVLLWAYVLADLRLHVPSLRMMAQSLSIDPFGMNYFPAAAAMKWFQNGLAKIRIIETTKQ